MFIALLPLFAAAVAFVFAGQLGRQYVRRRRAHALAWALALALFGLASSMVTVGVAVGWSPLVFGVYWVAGALLNVPLLAVGQLMLLDPRRSVLYWTLAGLFAVWAVAFTLLAGFDQQALNEASTQRAIPLGREVLGRELAYALARPFSLTFAIVVAGSVWSAVRARRWSVLFIALGVTLAALSSAFIRVGHGELFSVLLAAGVSTMYAGFRSAGRAPRAPREPVAT